MGLQPEAIESRLEGLKVDEHRKIFDSQLREFRIDSKPQSSSSQLPIPVRKPEPTPPVDRMIMLLEELSMRIDGLEKKQRQVSNEIRYRDRQDRRWRSALETGGLLLAGTLAVRWLLYWI